MKDETRGITRRAWLATTATQAGAMLGFTRNAFDRRYAVIRPLDPRSETFGAAAELLDLEPVRALAQRAVDAATSAGATYADTRLTRTVDHYYPLGGFGAESELVGCGVRALVNGCWGFASAPVWLSEPDRAELVVRLAREAVAQAKTQARLATAANVPHQPVELSPAPAVTGTWQTPCRIDPFRVSVEEKLATMAYWIEVSEKKMNFNPPNSHLHFVRQERVLATSEGTLVTQTCYESGGDIQVKGGIFSAGAPFHLRDLSMSGQGWERILDARVPEQLLALRGTLGEKPPGGNGVAIGRYTLVCDGMTMGAVLGETLGVALQLDRALGEEANAGGTSFVNDPLAMLGTFRVASPHVTVTANRSAPTQLATVKWDDEGVVPPEVTLVKDGVLHDLQTTRDQATRLAPYYQRVGHPVASNGCAAAQDGRHMTLQMRPNFALAPSATSASLEMLLASVKNGFFLEQGEIVSVDAQARNALLRGRLRKIVHGKLVYDMPGAAVQLNTLDFWKNVQAVGDASTTGVYGSSQDLPLLQSVLMPPLGRKGQPAQRTSYSAQGVAAVVTNQAIIDPVRKA